MERLRSSGNCWRSSLIQKKKFGEIYSRILALTLDELGDELGGRD
ncbi:hypothetical protein VQ056_31235 [Paenibacillus sp. JTLBN-2024]